MDSGENISAKTKEVNLTKKFLLRVNGVRSFFINLIDNAIEKCGDKSQDTSTEQLITEIRKQLVHTTSSDNGNMKELIMKTRLARGFVPCVCDYDNLNQKLLLTGERKPPMFCELCYKTYGSAQGFRLHKLSHLIRAEVFHCPVTGCNVNESQAGRLLAHLRKEHKENSSSEPEPTVENKLDARFRNSLKPYNIWERNRMFDSDEEEKVENDGDKEDGKLKASVGKKYRGRAKRKALETSTNEANEKNTDLPCKITRQGHQIGDPAILAVNVSDSETTEVCMTGVIETTINTTNHTASCNTDISSIVEENTSGNGLERYSENINISTTTHEESSFTEKESSIQQEYTIKHVGYSNIGRSTKGNTSVVQHVTKQGGNKCTKDIICSSDVESSISPKTTTKPATITREPLVPNNNDDLHLSGDSTNVSAKSNSKTCLKIQELKATKNVVTPLDSLQDINSSNGSLPVNTERVEGPTQIRQRGWWSKFPEENIVGMDTERVNYKPSVRCSTQSQCAEISVTNNGHIEKQLVVFHRSEQLMHNRVYHYPSVAPLGAVSLADATAIVKRTLKNYLIIVFDGKEDFKGLNLDMDDFNVFDLSDYFQKYTWNKDDVRVLEKISLKRLVKHYFREDIQTGQHSSMEDAKYTRKLFMETYTKIHPEPFDRHFKDYGQFDKIPDKGND